MMPKTSVVHHLMNLESLYVVIGAEGEARGDSGLYVIGGASQDGK